MKAVHNGKFGTYMYPKKMYHNVYFQIVKFRIHIPSNLKNMSS